MHLMTTTVILYDYDSPVNKALTKDLTQSITISIMSMLSCIFCYLDLVSIYL